MQSRQSFLGAAEALLDGGDEGAALALAKERLAALPGDPDARMVACRVLIGQGRDEEAKAALAELEELVSSLGRLYREMGDRLFAKGMTDGAGIYYRRFAALSPEAPAVQEIADRIRDFPPAEDRKESGAEEAVEVPEDFQTVTLAELYIRQGHGDMAKEVLRAILRKDPGQERALRMLGEIGGNTGGDKRDQKEAPVIAELTRWLDNLGRLRGHAA